MSVHRSFRRRPVGADLFTVLALLAAWVGLAAVCSPLRADDSATQAVRSYYAASPDREAQHYSRRLAGHLKAAIGKSRELNEPVSGIDFGPKIAGQDIDPGYTRTLSLDLASQSAVGASVRARFVRFPGEPAVTLVYTLVREGGRWKIDDIEKSSMPDPWRWSELLALGAQGK